jgi:hypothetical protein
VLAVPAGVSEAYSSVAISVTGVAADPSEASGYRFLQMTVPISEFARSSTVGSLGTQISSVSASMTLLTQDLASLQSSTSAADTALAGQVSSIGTRVSAIEGGLSTFATTSSLNGVSTRVSAIEGSLGSFATAGGLNAVSTRVSSLETTVASLPTAANLNDLSARVSGAETQLAAIQSAVAGLEAFIPEALEGARREADEGSAMAAAMTTVAPADGKANRIGFNTATYNGSTAVAVSYSRAAGDVDFNVGVAMAGEYAMVKAGAGFSW